MNECRCKAPTITTIAIAIATLRTSSSVALIAIPHRPSIPRRSNEFTEKLLSSSWRVPRFQLTVRKNCSKQEKPLWDIELKSICESLSTRIYWVKSSVRVSYFYICQKDIGVHWSRMWGKGGLVDWYPMSYTTRIFEPFEGEVSDCWCCSVDNCRIPELIDLLCV